MIRSCCTLFVLFVCLALVPAASANPRIGMLLDDALCAREHAPVEEVSAKFLAADQETANPRQKWVILSLFSDYLLRQRQWAEVIPVQNKILQLKVVDGQAVPLYNLIWANLELDQPVAAKEAAAELNASPSGWDLCEHIHQMKQSSRNGIHDRISDLLLATPAAAKLTTPEPSAQGTRDERAVSPSWDSMTLSAGDYPPPADEPWLANDVPADISHPAVAPSDEKRVVVPENAPEKGKGAEKIEIHVGGWTSGLAGDIDSQGASIDFADDLSNKRKQTSAVLSATFPLTHRDRVKVSYVNFSFSGNLNKTFIHNAKTFRPGDSFHHRTVLLDLEGYRKWQDRGNTALGFLYGLMYSDSEMKVVQTGCNGCRVVSTWQSNFGYPYLGLAASSRLGKHAGWDASIKWFSWSGNGRYNTHDAELRILFGPGYARTQDNSKWWAYVGYRDFAWEGDFDHDSGGIGFSGPVFGVEFAI